MGMNCTKIINLYGGPGTGKSTTAASLYAYMKGLGWSVELVREYAKDVVWSGNTSELVDQMWISANQARRIGIIYGKVDYIITDSPILLGCAYTNRDKNPMLYESIIERHKSYNNIEIFLKRMKEYDPNGRVQTYKEALEKDLEISNMLERTLTHYEELVCDCDVINKIMELV